MAIELEFEKPILELERRIQELQKFTEKESIDLSGEINKLTDRLEKLRREVFENMTPWQRVQLARHPDRPYTLDYVGMLMEDFTEIHGDRHFGDDRALIGGVARMNGKKLMLIGHQKGRDTKENLARNFGCAHPEGYRKAMRLMYIAEKFRLPVVTMIDTPGAYPGVGAEERGQAEAIAYNLREMAGLKVPIVAFVIGEGGSGGALGIGVADRVFVLENGYYSVISPEGCAAILWKDRTRASSAADSLKLTAPDLIKLGLIDGMIPEPLGGAHRDPKFTADGIRKALTASLEELCPMEEDELVKARYDKYRAMGEYRE